MTVCAPIIAACVSERDSHTLPLFPSRTTPTAR